jgi:hypothetical protein
MRCARIAAPFLMAISLFGASTTAKAPKEAPLTDAEIQADLRMRLNRGKIAADHFQATVKGGVATLTGHTDVVQHKGVATRLAKTAGARRVDNQIQISDAARKKAAERLATHQRSGDTQRSETPVKRSEVTRGG